MYAPHHTILHLVKYSTALTEITEHCRALDCRPDGHTTPDPPRLQNFEDIPYLKE